MVEAARGLSSSASRKRRGCTAGLRRPDGAFGQLRYLTPPEALSDDFKDRVLYRSLGMDWDDDPAPGPGGNGGELL
jgi:hypothetical protein